MDKNSEHGEDVFNRVSMCCVSCLIRSWCIASILLLNTKLDTLKNALVALFHLMTVNGDCII